MFLYDIYSAENLQYLRYMLKYGENYQISWKIGPFWDKFICLYAQMLSNATKSIFYRV